MAFEALPAEYDEFFKTGVVPDSLKEPAPVVEPAAPAATPTAEVKPAEVAPTPTVTPPTDAYDRLLREAERQRIELQKKVEELQGTVGKLTATPAPDPNEDPLGFINHQMKTLQDQIAALTKQQQEASQQTTEQTQQAAFLSAVNNQIKTFEATNPDYQEAYRHMIQMRSQDYIDSGMTATEAKAAVANDELAIAARAMQQGKNPAEIVYGMAKRYGFKPAPAKTTPENKLETIKSGLEASKTVERGSQPTEVSLDSLQNMGDSELTEMVESQWEKLFGKSKSIFG